MFGTILFVLAILILFVLAYVRFAPVAATAGPGRPEAQPVGTYRSEGGFYAVVSAETHDLAKLEAAIMTWPKARKMEEGLYLTRSPAIRFPDLVHVWQAEGLIHISAHLIYGRKDFGANRARVEQWLAAATN
ncbi:MAG: DUF1499 domain-containing protein [Rhodobacteraceae bacterium]|nr:DUF1499 domain-containing protein [Paracoccaceae bacterium]